MIQVSHPYTTTGKTIALTTWNLVNKIPDWKMNFILFDKVDKVMSLFFDMLYRFVIDFCPRSKHLWLWYLQSSSTVIMEPKKRKYVTVSTFPLLFAMKYWDQMPWFQFFFFFIGFFLTEGLNSHILHCRQILSHHTIRILVNTLLNGDWEGNIFLK